MRWLVWLLVCTPCLAGSGGPLLEVRGGTSGREVVVEAPPRNLKHMRGRIYLVGTMTEVSAEVDRQPQQTRLSEVGTLRVESAFGDDQDDLRNVEGVATALLKASYEQSPYIPVGDDWGRLWHLDKGQRLLVILHICEEELGFDPEEVVVLDERTAALPETLRRIGSDFSRVRASDPAVLNAAGPLFHGEAVRAAQALLRIRDEQATFLNQLVAVCMALFFGTLLCADLFRRPLLSPQNPTT